MFLEKLYKHNSSIFVIGDPRIYSVWTILHFAICHGEKQKHNIEIANKMKKKYTKQNKQKQQTLKG